MGKVEEGHSQKETNVLKLSKASYKTFLRYQNDIEDLLPEREVKSCEEDSDQVCEDDSPADVVFGGMLLRTASGRPFIRPNRLDL